MKRPACSSVLLACFVYTWAGSAWCQIVPWHGRTLFVEGIDAAVNDEVILAGEVEERLGWIAARLGEDLEDPETYEKWRKDVLDEMINDLLLYQWGVEHGLELRKDQLKQRVDEETRLRSENEEIQRLGGLEAALAEVGRSTESFSKSLARSIQREYVINQAIRINIESKISISDAYIERFKNNNPDLFRKEQRVKVRQILLRCPRNAPPEEEKNVAALAEQIYLQLKAGADFVDMVHRHSDHAATRRQDGEMAPYSRGELADAFDIAFELKPGEISRPFRSASGYHILLVEGKQSIEEYLHAEQKKKKLEAWLKELRSKAVIRRKTAGPEL